eukprot:gene32313-16883_t
MSYEPPGYMKWVVFGSATTIAIGAGYFAYKYLLCEDDEEDSPPVVTSFAQKANPELPSRSAPKKAVVKPATTLKTCARCSKSLTGLPLRCSKCKAVYYCSPVCQKEGWADHKANCKPAAKSATGAGTGGAKPTDAETSGAKPTDAGTSGAKPTDAASSGAKPTDAGTSEAKPSDAATSEGKPAEVAPPTASEAGKPKPRSMEEALAQMLEETSAEKAGSDNLDGMFERSVMLFLRGEYRQSLALLKEVQDLAVKKGEKSMQGEVEPGLLVPEPRVTKMPLCYFKRHVADSAEAMFQEGVKFSEGEKLLKLQVDCLSGLGILFRTQNEAEKAVGFLSQALVLSEKAGDADSCASTLVNLGSALMSIDQEKGVESLKQAVILREAAMEKYHLSGEHSGLATAVMEHANATVNLAGALYVMKRLDEAKVAFVRCLEVFELVEDVDKVTKVLVNLANMCGIQMKEMPDCRIEAAVHRQKLVEFLNEKGLRAPSLEEPCAICMEPLDLMAPSPEGKEILTLACFHCFHDECWNKWSSSESAASMPAAALSPASQSAATLTTASLPAASL